MADPAPATPPCPPKPPPPADPPRCWICWENIDAASPHAHPRSRRRRSVVRTCEGCRDEDLQYAHQHCFERWIDSQPPGHGAGHAHAHGAADRAPAGLPGADPALVRAARRVLAAGPWASLLMGIGAWMVGPERAGAAAGDAGAGAGARMGRRGSGALTGGRRDTIPYRCNRCQQSLTLSISTRPLNPFLVMYRETGLVILLALLVSVLCAAALALACALAGGSYLVRAWWGEEAMRRGMLVWGVEVDVGGRAWGDALVAGGDAGRARLVRVVVPDAVERMGWGPVAAGIALSGVGWALLLKFILHPFHGRVVRHVRGLVKQLADDTAPGLPALPDALSGRHVMRPRAPAPAASALGAGGYGGGVVAGAAEWWRRLAGQPPAAVSAPRPAALAAIPEADEDGGEEDDEDEDELAGVGVGGLLDLVWEIAGVGSWAAA